MATTTPTVDDVRGRREALGISRLALAVRTGVSPTWMQALEAGLRPHGKALDRVLAALDDLERIDHEEPA